VKSRDMGKSCILIDKTCGKKGTGFFLIAGLSVVKETQDHLEILLEDIRGKFDLVLEGHDTLRQEIQDTREELGEKIKLVGFKVDTIIMKIDGWCTGRSNP